MIDICTVVFEEELPILRLQAQSIDLYCQNISINSIYVIVNDSLDVVKKIDTAWWGSLQDRVVVIPRSAFGSYWVDNGWVSQQVLKLLGASISYNTYTMVLDAKTIFVKELLLNELFNDRKQLCVGQITIYDVFSASKEITNNLFDINISEQAGPGGVPFFIHNNTIRSLISDVTNKTAISFPQWFQDQGMLTEFILYSGYVISKHGSLDKFYSKNSNFLINNVCHSEVGIFDIKLKQASDNRALTVSVHRGAWQQLSNEQKTQYKEFLNSKKISLAWTIE